MIEEGILLTDICQESNQKITYSGDHDSENPVSIQTSKITSWNVFQQTKSVLKSIFLPRGYPDSVSQDYLEYQIWDTCQAFCSSISGTLAMQAVMQGIGVGSETATPASAAIMWLMKDGTGMVGSILFAWLKGSKLDSDCKKWRFFADVLNDIAMFAELYVPLYLEYSLYILCVSTLLKALVGTAGGSTRAALITHQAIKDNIADVSAKDGSQEIFVNLCAFILGVTLLNLVSETEEVWTIMCTATFFHLLFNYKAVKCLRIRTLNNERFMLVLRAYLPTSFLPSVEQVNKRESVFLFSGLKDLHVIGFSVEFGVCLKKAIQSQRISVALFSTLVGLFQNKKYIIIPNIKKQKLCVAFRESFQEKDILMAYFHASLLGISLTYLENNNILKILLRTRKNSPLYRLRNILEQSTDTNLEKSGQESLNSKLLLAYTTCKAFVEKEFLAFCWACEEAGWNTDNNLINVHNWRAVWVSTVGRRGEKVKLQAPNFQRDLNRSREGSQNSSLSQNGQSNQSSQGSQSSQDSHSSQGSHGSQSGLSQRSKTNYLVIS